LPEGILHRGQTGFYFTVVPSNLVSEQQRDHVHQRVVFAGSHISLTPSMHQLLGGVRDLCDVDNSPETPFQSIQKGQSFSTDI
jgi:hypothetical protein